MTQAETIERPYQLPRHLYALWYDAGQQLGSLVQATVFVALTTEGFRVYDKALSPGEKVLLQALAQERGILLQFR